MSRIALDPDGPEVDELDFAIPAYRRVEGDADEGFLCPVDHVPLWRRRGVSGLTCPVCHKSREALER